MVKLTLPFRLADPHGARACGSMSTVALPHGSWEELVQEIRHQHPSIAERVLTGSGGVASGFALVVNDEVVNGGCLPPHLSPGDELYLIPTFAGG